MTFLENVLANVEADSYVFENYKEEACKKLENYFDQRYEPLLLLEGGAADHPSCFHEERGKLCGYAFERGDLVYRCKDCGRDPTCVLCANCFQYEDHEGHEIYYNITTHSGGCCDCGDNEAWNIQLKCILHQNILPESSSSPENVPDLTSLSTEEASLLNEIVVTLTNTFMIGYSESVDDDINPFEIMGFTIPTKKIDNFASSATSSHSYFPEEFNPYFPNTEKHAEFYSLVLYNDERHSFDEVISVLCDSIGCDRDIARVHAETVDRYGRAIIETGTEHEKYLRISSLIQRVSLKCDVLPALSVYFQDCAFQLMLWFTQKVSSRPYLQRVFSMKLCETCNEDNVQHPSPFTTKIHSFTFDHWNRERQDFVADISEFLTIPYLKLFICMEVFLWKSARVTLKELLMNTMLKAYEWKVKLAEIFTDSYPSILSYFNLDREPELSILFFSVQLYTVPSIVTYLTRECKLIQRILTAIILEFEKVQHSESLDINFEHDFILNRRYFHPFQDIRYLLDGCSYEDFTYSDNIENDKYHGLNGKSLCIEYFFKFLSIFENIHLNERVIGEHVEFETDHWVHAFNLSLQTSRLAREFGQFCSKGEFATEQILNILQKLYDWLQKNNFRQNNAHVEKEKGIFSFHHSLHWFLAHLLRGLFASTKQFPSFEFPKYISRLLYLMAPTSYCLQIYLSQIRAGMWVRNGFSLKAQVQNYQSPMLLEDMRDQDLYLIQCHILINQKSALESILKEFDLEVYLANLNSEYTCCIVEDFLLLTIYSLSREIYRVTIKEHELLETFIIQWMFIEADLSYSDIVKKMPSQLLEQRTAIDSAISTVALTKRKRDKEAYTLKGESMEKVDIFFPYYTLTDRHNCLEKIFKSKPKEIGLFVSPKIDEIISEYLAYPEFQTTLTLILDFILKEEKESEYIFIEIIYLIRCFKSSFPLETLDFTTRKDNGRSSIAEYLDLINREKLDGRYSQILSSILSIQVEKRKTHIEQVDAGGGIVVDVKSKALQRKERILAQFQYAQSNFMIEMENELNEKASKQLEESERDDAEVKRREVEAKKLVFDRSLESESRAFKGLNLKIFDLGDECVVCRESITTPKSIAGIMCDFNEVNTVRYLNGSLSCAEPPLNRVLNLKNEMFSWNTRSRNSATCCKHVVHYECFSRSQLNGSNGGLATLLQRFLAGETADVMNQLSNCPVCRKKVKTFLPLFVPKETKALDMLAEPWLSDQFFVSSFIETLKAEIGNFKAWKTYWNTVYNQFGPESSNQNFLYEMQMTVISYNSINKSNALEFFLLVIADLVESTEIFLRTFSGSDFDEFVSHQEMIINGILNLIPYEICKLYSGTDFVNTFVSGQLRKKFDLSRGSPLDSLVRTTLLLWMPSSRDHLDKYKNYCMELFVNYISNLYSSLVLDPRIDLVNCADRLSLIKTTSKSMASFIQCLLEDLLGYHDKRPFPLLCHYADLFLRQIGIFTKFYFAFPTVESFSEIDIFQFLGISTSNPETFFQKTENYFKNIMKLPKIPPMSDFLYPFPYHIVQLPNRFDELVMKTLRIACANCKKVPNETAICLFCGKLCCAQSYCCLSTTSEITVPLLGSTLSIGECNQHVLDGCCNSFGGFLFIQRAAILLLTIRGKGCFRPAPYIDSHGEADFGLRRGSPLFLDEALLKHYEYLWLTHSVPSAIESANQEDNSNNGNYNPRLWLSM